MPDPALVTAWWMLPGLFCVSWLDLGLRIATGDVPGGKRG